MTDVCRAYAAICVGAFVGWHLFCPPAQAQFFPPAQFELSNSVHVDEAESSVRAQLERVRACVADQQWDEAVETLRQIMENPGGKVIAIAENRYVNLADYCHAQIASLPPPALQLYRQRVDAVARKWYEQGIAERNRGRLSTVVSQSFCSSWGDKALLALGEMALEQGQHDAARGYWGKILEYPPETIPAARFQAAHQQARLAAADVARANIARVDRWYRIDNSPDPPVYRLRHDELLTDDDAAGLIRFWKMAGLPPIGLSYPGTSLPLADIRARLVLASILEGSLERAGGELEAFSQRHAGAEGLLAGRRGKYAATLTSLLTAAAAWPAQPASADWPTFAGAYGRNKVALESLELGPEMAWPAIDLGEPLSADVTNSRTFSSLRVAEDAQGLLSYHPVVAGGLIFVNNATQIMAFNLYTGKPAWPAGVEHKLPGEFFTVTDARTHAVNRGLGVPRFTMTIHGDRLYARMGSQVTIRSLESQDTYSNCIVCVDLSRQGARVWEPLKPDDEKWSFEGAPVVDGSNVYVAMRKSDVRPQEHVACFDAETKRLKWRTLVCAAETPGGGWAEELTHNLLTLEQGVLYCNTNLGAVAAISAQDGQTQWVTLYPRAKRASPLGQDRRAAHFYRDLNPCVFYRGLLMVAPSDCEGIFAIDATSGRMIWESHLAEDAVHLLGVGSGNLLASGDRLWWIDAAGGKVLGSWPDNKAPHGYGRGVLADGRVYWPTREYLYVFDQKQAAKEPVSRLRDPIPLTNMRGITGGNLVPADGMLLIAAANKIYGFRQGGSHPMAILPAMTAPPPGAASPQGAKPAGPREGKAP